MGINVIGSWPVEMFQERVRDFVQQIASAHPDRWVFCIDLFTCIYDLTQDPQIVPYRQVVREIVESFSLPRLVYLNGRSLLTHLTGLTADLVHPSSEGMQEIAANLSARILDKSAG
jgi:hypothetical protein